MQTLRNDIIYKLNKEILPLQGLKKLRTDNDLQLDCRAIENAFPDAQFPIGCTHEFISKSFKDVASTNGFALGIISKLLRLGGVCVWISTSNNIFPSALTTFNIHPEQIIFINLKNEKDVLAATEEALKCNRITAVLSDIKNISFKESRRFQLATEQSRVTGFILRNQPRIINTIASVSRWHVTSLPSLIEDDLPGIGFPRWNVELLKVRNGTPGKWIMEWNDNNLHVMQPQKIEVYDGLRKIS